MEGRISILAHKYIPVGKYITPPPLAAAEDIAFFIDAESSLLPSPTAPKLFTSYVLVEFEEEPSAIKFESDFSDADGVLARVDQLQPTINIMANRVMVPNPVCNCILMYWVRGYGRLDAMWMWMLWTGY